MHDNHNRHNSFAPPREDNKAEYYIDGCEYFHAVSVAIENAHSHICIMGWWISPELYLRRPPSSNEKYRLDRMLHNAAERHIKVYVIVYHEVPTVLTINSLHTEEVLKSLHENISVLRHPSHTFTLKHHNLSELFFWAHHEKLCIVDGEIAFMGGLDLCFGRWDTHQHQIADAHPAHPKSEVWPGQDFNNGRIKDFEDVPKHFHNKLDRSQNSRMGWSDISISIQGGAIKDLQKHFTQRWKFISKKEINICSSASKFAAESINTPDCKAEGSTLQILRSCSMWSHGVATEHSIQNAYIEVIYKSEHFIYLENQFFITATESQVGPVHNRVGAAIVERIFRAFNEKKKYKVIVCIPAVPGFAGDLHDKTQESILAIMNLQYKSICRGGHSIMERLTQKGIDNVDNYISFYNLRSYDRINSSRIGQKDSRYKDMADSVSSCYMLDGLALSSMTWDSDQDEMDAFVSEQLYVHSKCLIADDRIVIIGSANLNDRSLLGDHDSEIAVIIEDGKNTEKIASKMNGQPYEVSKFATTLRRRLFRKHIGLIEWQDWTKLDEPKLRAARRSDAYDWQSPADCSVEDPLSLAFDALWRDTAKVNTETFTAVFSPVPCNEVRNWEAYDSHNGELSVETSRNPAQYGHVVRPNFPEGVMEMKKVLGKVRGTLVEMPLSFLCDVEPLVRRSLGYNELTSKIYA